MRWGLLYPCEVPLEAVDVQLGPLGVHEGADGEEVLGQRRRSIQNPLSNLY